MESPASRYETARTLICKLRDVSSCDIQSQPDGTIVAVHVTARAGRSPKQIARDIEAILAAEEGVHLDHRKISIAQFGEGELPGPATLERRVSVAGVSLHQAGPSYDAEVTLTAGEVQSVGRATGSKTRFEVPRLIAAATLDAVSKLVEGDPGLSLGEIEEKDLGGKRVLIVCVNQTQGRNETHLFGCYEIGYDPTQAAIFAVLDALNRFLGMLEPREPVEYRIGPAPHA